MKLSSNCRTSRISLVGFLLVLGWPSQPAPIQGAEAAMVGKAAPDKGKSLRQWPVFDPSLPREVPVPAPDGPVRVAGVSPRAIVTRGSYTSVQVNVDGKGNNILDDAANEPSIAVDPTNRSRMAIAWRQFDTVANSFRQAGVANTTDAGATWNAQTLDPGQFRSDPVLASDRFGNFYFSSLSSTTSADLFRSADGGATWLGPVSARGGDKQWITVDATTGIGSGLIYETWNQQFSCCGATDFARSIDGGLSFQAARSMPTPKVIWGTLDVGPDGTLYVAGANFPTHYFLSSTNAKNPATLPTFSTPKQIDLGGFTVSGGYPNPGGLAGQVWIAADRSNGTTRGNIYVLGSVYTGEFDPLDVMFIRSTDGGATWSEPVRVNDDSPSETAWQWFAAMSVAPNGRIDVAWNDTRNDETMETSEVYYSWSADGGLTWSANVPVTPAFNHFEGYPSQNKIGDYIHMISDAGGANLAFAATFNHEQDVYYVRIAADCNGNGVEDAVDISVGTSADCTRNGTPDECEADCNGNGVADSCDILAGTSEDCTGNGVPDECEVDCNANGQSDLCDIANHNSADANHNGIPDECEAVLFVRQGVSGKRTGLSWVDAYASLQAALAHAAIAPNVVLEIWVASGTYIPSSADRTQSFDLPNGVAVLGGFSGNEAQSSQRNWHRNVTILSGDLLGNDAPGPLGRSENSYHVVDCANCDQAVLDGFVITGGHADGNIDHQNGGGVLIHAGQPTIRNCRVVDNQSDFLGGGLFASATHLSLENCLLAGNVANEGSALYSTRGSTVEMTQCTIASNAALGVGAAAGDYSENTLISHNSLFWGNTDFSGSAEDAQLTGMSTVSIGHSTVEGWSGQYGGTGNNGDDPVFADANGADNTAATPDDDFRLTFGSPAIDTGFVSLPTLASPDLDGHPRMLCLTVDRGAYEFGTGDSDCNGVVNSDDFAAFGVCLAGPNAAWVENCLAFDFDVDGDVDLIDFGLMAAYLSE